jgi:stage II sporulation protein D
MQLALISLLFSFCVVSPGFTTSAGRNAVVPSNFNTPLRVLLDKGQQELRVKSVLNSLYVKEDQGKLWTKMSGQAVIQLSRNKNNILVNKSPFKGPVIYVRGGPQHTDPIQFGSGFYRGALKITLTKTGLIVTNVIPLEDYLYGMVAGEMNPNWEMEALKAQVVAARTYAMYMIKHPKSPLYDLEKGTADQVYLGAHGETNRIKVAVESTRNQFISKSNIPIKTYYHSRCGGATEPAKQVWNPSEKHSHTSVPCPYCRKFPYQWKASVKAKDFFSVLKIPLKEIKPFKISLAHKTATGRVKEIAVEIDKEKHLINSEDLRHLLGYAQVKSTRFDVLIENDQIMFQGTGSGHGVGMCQWGAQFLAKQGKSYREILAHYYPSYELN